MVTFSPAATNPTLIPFMSALLSQLSNPCFESSSSYTYSCDFLTCPGWEYINGTAVPTPNACETGPSGKLQEFDYVVLGGGPGGAIVASRLAKKYKHSLVLIIDKADDHAANTAVPGLYTQNLKTENVKKYYVESQDNFGKVYKVAPTIHVGSGLGGSSATRDLSFLCGNKGDFKEWEKATGSKSWNYENMNRYIRRMTGASDGKSEDTCKDCENVYGSSGPVTLNTAPEIPEGSDAPILIKAARAEGYEVREDVDCKHTPGFTYVRSMIKNGERVGAAQAFLSPLAKSKNLHIIRNAHVDKILLKSIPCSSESSSRSSYSGSGSKSGSKHRKMKAKVEGILIQTNNPNCPSFVVKVKRDIILTTGNHNTPQTLLRSGIGRKEDLEKFGIDQKLNLPVGRTYRDKVYSLSYIAVPSTCDSCRDPLQDFLEFRNGSFSSISLDEPNAFFNLEKSESHSHSHSDSHKRKHHKRRHERHEKHEKFPNIQWRTKLFDVGAFDGDLISEVYDYKPEFFDKLTELNANHKLIEIKSYLLKPKSVGKLGLRSVDPSDPPIIEGEYLTEECDVKVLVNGLKLIKEFAESDTFKDLNAELVHLPIVECDSLNYGCEEYWKCYLKYFAFPARVAAGTCPMGKPEKCKAVVDKQLKVIGIEGKPRLRIADSSVMPQAVFGNSLCAGYLTSWKTASMIISDRG